MSAVPVETPKAAARRIASSKIKGAFVAEALYEYQMADGSPWCWRIRCKLQDGSKWIRPMRWNGTGYEEGEPDKPETGKPIYRLPEVLAANDTVWIVEGEKCADALAALGLVSTTSGGSSSANSADWSPLAGRCCVIWPDTDEADKPPAGSTYCSNVAAILRKLGCTVEVVDVDSLGLPGGGDCVDWLDAHVGSTKADVEALPLRAAQPIENVDSVDKPAAKDIVASALERLGADPGAIFEKDVLAAVRHIRESDPAEYQRVRARAKAAKAAVTELDRLTSLGETGECDDPFPEVIPWSRPVDGSTLLLEVCGVLKRHVIADEPTIIAAALWVIHTWCMDTVTVSPLAHITAPEKRCGKTILLTALSRLVCRPMAVSNITPAALFRSMEAWQPTLLVDEADTFLRDNDEARGLINSGLYRETAYVVRSVGDDHVPTKFSTWGAKALCGIGRLADTIEDRSIPLRMRRRVGGEVVENIRHSDPKAWETLSAKLARWSADNAGRVGARHPIYPLGLNDRAQDCWEPLLSIAEVVGGDWPARARDAAVELHGVEEEAPTIGVELLTAIREVFERKKARRIASSDLLDELVKDDDGPWATWNRGKAMSPRQLADRVKGFGIKPETTRLPDGRRLKGYDLKAFTDAFARYLSDEQGAKPRDAVTTALDQRFQGISIRDAGNPVTDAKDPEMALDRHCHAVTDETTDPASVEVLDL